MTVGQGHWGTPGCHQHPPCLGQALCSVHHQDPGHPVPKTRCLVPPQADRSQVLGLTLSPGVQGQPQRSGTGLRHLTGGWSHPNPSSVQERWWRSHLWSLCVANVLLQGHMSPVTPGDKESPFIPCARGRSSKDLLSQCLGDTGALPCCRGGCCQPEMPSGCQRGRDMREGESGMATNRTPKPPGWARPQGYSPLPPHLKGLGIMGIHQQLLWVHVMFPGPGNTHTQILGLVITQLQPCPIRVGVSQISP